MIVEHKVDSGLKVFFFIYKDSFYANIFKSYIAGPSKVSEATPLLSRSNHREKYQRKAEEKKT